MRRYTYYFSKYLKKRFPDQIELYSFSDIRNDPASESNSYMEPWSDSRIVREQLQVPVQACREVDRLLVPAYLGPVLSPVPVDLIVYDLLYLRKDAHQGLRQKIYWKGLYQWVFRRANCLFPISKATRDRIVDYLPWVEPKLGPVLYPGAPDPMSVSRSTSRNGVDGEYILTVGTVSPRKNIHTLVKCYRQSPELYENVDLRIAGRYGWGAPHPETYHDPKRGILWEGSVSENRLHRLYSGAELLILPSRAEGFGLPILEAFTHRLPVVLNDLNVFREVARDGAWYLSGDLDNWASIIEEALRFRAKRIRKVTIGQRRLQKFRWSRSVSSYLEETGGVDEY